MYYKSLFICVTILLLLSFANPAKAYATDIILKSHPSQVLTMEEFEIAADLGGLEGATVYQAKGWGGTDDLHDIHTYSSKTNSFLSWNGAWNDHPEFTTNASGSATITLKMRFKQDSKQGTNQLQIRIKKKDIVQDPFISETKTLQVNLAPSSTPTPSKTPTPQASATPTKTPTPSLQHTVTPTPKSPTPTLITLIGSTQETGLGTNRNEIAGGSVSPIATKSADTNIALGVKITLILGLIFLGTGIIIFTQKLKETKKSRII